MVGRSHARKVVFGGMERDRKSRALNKTRRCQGIISCRTAHDCLDEG